MNPTHLVSVAALVTNESGKILLINSPWRGWEYPGGLIEPGETFQQALHREIREEAGVEVEITGFVGICKNVEKDIVNIDFTAKYVSGELTTSEEKHRCHLGCAGGSYGPDHLPLDKKAASKYAVLQGRSDAVLLSAGGRLSRCRRGEIPCGKGRMTMLDKELQTALIQKGREFTRGSQENDPYEADFESDQDRKLPQPPLVKPAVTAKETHIPLTRDFSGLDLKNDLVSLFRDRRSARVYTQETVTQAQLSFLLWATQGVKSIRGKSYATLRTVPCGGARHEFETYLLIRKIDGLRPGAYHYLPMEHALEFLHEVPDLDAVISQTLCGQVWAAKANVVFYWSAAAYRAEWRYGIYAHRPMLMDVGHVGQNLYLACTGLGLGCCAIAAFSHEKCREIFGLDGEEEYIIYTVPVGTVREQDRAEEQAFYQFVEDEGL